MKTTQQASVRASSRRAVVVRGSVSPLVSKRQGRAKVIPLAPPHTGGADNLADHEQAVIDAAMAILRARLRQPDGFLNSPNEARTLALLHLARRDHECFIVMFLDARHGLITIEELFRGTLTQTSVYPREVVRAALKHNAATVILAHNHPTGEPEPSPADKILTQELKAALKLVDVNTLDHLIVTGDRVMSFAEWGLL